MKDKIAIGLSGGVDSAVAAYMLISQGFEVMGITLRLAPCAHADTDISDAARVAEALGIEHRVLDIGDKFEEKVVSPFISEYLHGRTPNPCIVCNREIKFGAMLDFALECGCSSLATGHYARVENGVLLRSHSKKDQSYFLCRLSREQLMRAVFPLGSLEKEEIRRIALEANLPSANRRDSLEICFVENDDYSAFLTSRGVTSSNGDIIDSDGNVIGAHNGIINYTIGQRKGLGAFGRPVFVTAIDATKNTVTVGDNGEQYSDGLIADTLSLINPDSLDGVRRAEVKIRFRACPAPALVTPLGGGKIKVEFDEPQRSVTPGQTAAIYDGDTVLGGARIIQIGFR